MVAQHLQMSELAEDEVDNSAEEEETFARNPVTFMSEWLAHRRESDILQTPMGYILRGRIEALHPGHAFFTAHTDGGQAILEAPLSTEKRRQADDDDEEDDDDDNSDLDHDGDDIEEGWDDLGEELGAGFGEDVGDENVGDENIGDGPERVAAEKALFED